MQFHRINTSPLYIVSHLILMMADVEDESDCSTCGNPNDHSEYDSNTEAENALDKLCCALGGTLILPHLIEATQPMLTNGDWRQRQAALKAVSVSGEGCKTQMEPMLGSIVCIALPLLKDPHPRVRHACIQALGLLATDFGPTFQEEFHSEVVSGLLMMMDNTNTSCVQAHAMQALVNFSQDCPKSILTLYLEPIVNKLEPIFTATLKTFLENGSKLVVQQLVTTIASVADVVEKDFMHYYDLFMPGLIGLLENTRRPVEFHMLWGKTIESITLMGLAVGKDKFTADFSRVMSVFVQTPIEESDMAQSDPRLSYMIRAWSRLWRLMGEDFRQFSPLAMGQIIKAASYKVDTAIVDDMDLEAREADEDWELMTLEDQTVFGIRKAGLEEKAEACEMLVYFFTNMKDDMIPYTFQIMRLTVINLKFYFNDDVRSHAAQLVPLLLDGGDMRDPECADSMCQFLCPELLKAIDAEPEPDVKSKQMQALAQCIEKRGKDFLSHGQDQILLGIIDKILCEHIGRQAKGEEEERTCDCLDESTEKSLEDEEAEDVMASMLEICDALFATHKIGVLPMFEQLLPHLVKLISADRSAADRQWSICVFDDLLEHTGPHAFVYQQHFLQPLMASLCDDHPMVRQAAAYGVGVMAMYGGELFMPACREAIPLLERVISAPNSKAPENVNATENAISAVTKICKHQPTAVNVDEILPQWLSWLPVWEDKVEATYIYDYLADLIEMKHPLILGRNNRRRPQILDIIAGALHRGALDADGEVMKRLAVIKKA